jgi:type I restriction enzyme S subunit
MKETGIPVYEQKNAIYNVREFRFFIDEEKFQELKRFQVKTNDLIISCSGTVGRISIIKEEDPKGIISQALLILRPDVTKIDLKHLFYFLSSKHGFELITQASHGSVQINIAERKVVENIPIFLPPLPEQTAIASVLSSIDNKIDLLHRQNATLEKMAETLFRQWFVEEAKEDWEDVKVKDVCLTITKGTTPTTLGKSFKVNGINFIKAESLTDVGTFVPEKFAFIDDDTNNLLKRSQIQEGDVLITIAGTIGRIGYVTKDILPANTNQAIGIMRVKREIINSYFLYCLFNSTEIKNDFHGRVVHAVQPNLSLGQIADIEFKLPPSEVLDSGMQKIEVLFIKKNKNTAQIHTLTALRDTLLPKLMSGEVKVEI